MKIRRFATLSRNARTLACVGNRLSSPKVRRCQRQRSRGSFLAIDQYGIVQARQRGGVVEAPVRLHQYGPGARAVVEGEARAPLILVDAQLGHAIDEPPTHLDLEPTPRLEERGQGADLKFQQREHPQPYTMT